MRNFFKEILCNNFSTVPVVIFRLSGIYGPGNNAIMKVKNGTARSVYKKDHTFSWIHVEDIAQIVVKCMEKITNSQIFNVSDDFPIATWELNNYAATLLGMEAPNVIDIDSPDVSESYRNFFKDNKKVANKKIKQFLASNVKNFYLSSVEIFH